MRPDSIPEVVAVLVDEIPPAAIPADVTAPRPEVDPGDVVSAARGLPSILETIFFPPGGQQP